MCMDRYAFLASRTCSFSNICMYMYIPCMHISDQVLCSLLVGFADLFLCFPLPLVGFADLFLTSSLLPLPLVGFADLFLTPSLLRLAVPTCVCYSAIFLLRCSLLTSVSQSLVQFCMCSCFMESGAEVAPLSGCTMPNAHIDERVAGGRGLKWRRVLQRQLISCCGVLVREGAARGTRTCIRGSDSKPMC